MNPSDKLLLLKKASSLPVGSLERKAILSRFEEKKAATKVGDAEALLGWIALKAGLDDSKVRRTPGGAELVDKEDWLTFTISISDDGRYEIKAEGEARGTLDYMPSDDIDEEADELLRGNPFRVLRR